VNIEHCDCLSWFRGSESHEQDGETLRSRAGAARPKKASSDPAMAFKPSSGRAGFGPSRKSAAASLPDEADAMHPRGRARIIRAQKKQTQRRMPSRSIKDL
jgi:hypothetical protein